MKRFLLSIAILVPFTWCYAQTGPEVMRQPDTVLTNIQTTTDPYALALAQVTLPPHKDSWAIQILTRGGFSGRGRGDMLIRSSGHISIVDNNVERKAKVPSGTRQKIAQMVSTVRLTDPPVKRDSLCNDCYVIVFALYRRAADGVQRQLTFVWDDSTFANLPSELKQLYSAAMAAREDVETKHNR